jgi:hypothetical protein
VGQGARTRLTRRDPGRHPSAARAALRSWSTYVCAVGKYPAVPCRAVWDTEAPRSHAAATSSWLAVDTGYRGGFGGLG